MQISMASEKGTNILSISDSIRAKISAQIETFWPEVEPKAAKSEIWSGD